MLTVFWSQERKVLAVESHAVQVAEIRILARLFSASQKIHNTFLFIHPDKLRHHPIAARDLVLQLAGGEIVEIKVSPVAAFGEPNNFVGASQVMPVRPARPARFILRSYFLFQHVAHLAGGGVRYPECGLLMVAGTGNKDQA